MAFFGVRTFFGEAAFFGVRIFGARRGGSLCGVPGFSVSLYTVSALMDGGSVNRATVLTLASSSQMLEATEGNKLIVYEK